MTNERGSRRTLEDILGDKALIDEVNTLAASSKDVTWGDNMVSIILRGVDEVERATNMGLTPVGSTLVIVRKRRDGEVLHSDEEIKKAVSAIKGR